MLLFTGLGQIHAKDNHYKKILTNKLQFRFDLICSRGPSVSYDGSNPFDIYPLIVECSKQEESKIDALVPGSIVYVEMGKIITWARPYNSKIIWNTILNVNVNNVKKIAKTSLGPSVNEHLRLSSNSSRFNNDR
jgi:hypothetical protein